MKIALTGGTGLLGRNLLLEAISQNMDKIESLKIFLLGREQENFTLEKRLILDLIPELLSSLPLENRQELLGILKKNIIPVPLHLTKDCLGMSESDLLQIKGCPIDLFIHSAALTDFRSDPSTSTRLDEININGTKRVLKLIKTLQVKQLAYVGSAYACGNKYGIIDPIDSGLEGSFRNHYEKTKLVAETITKEFAISNNIKLKIFRPSTISGRLINSPLGLTNKFDVFYGWAAFFLRYKLKLVSSPLKIFEETVEIKVRIAVNPEGGLNIVPVDYAAKMLIAACKHDTPDGSYHLVNSQEIKNIDCISWMLKALNITGHEFVDKEPDDKNKFEEFYYKTVGKIFTPYITCNPMLFCKKNLDAVEERIGISCPVVNEENFGKLMSYAKSKIFGLEI